jgi:hypothetical protein
VRVHSEGPCTKEYHHIAIDRTRLAGFHFAWIGERETSHADSNATSTSIHLLLYSFPSLRRQAVVRIQHPQHALVS